MNFDSFVDTLSDETRLGEASCRGLYDGDAIFGYGEDCSSAVIKMMQKQNTCKRYISTLSSSQRLVRDDGLIWGRVKANNYAKNVEQRVKSSQLTPCTSSFLPPRHFGKKTLQTLLDAGIIYKGGGKSSEVFMFGWNMGDFWELVSWPRDAEGGNVRFGLPVVADLDELMDETPKLSSVEKISEIPRGDFVEERNPFVVDVTDLKDLNDKILHPKKDCILFLSAAYCKTCHRISPQDVKLARVHAEAKNDVVFAKSNASSKIGKEVSRALGVNAVPAFCLFRAGKRYGDVMSVSHIPSKKLDVALDLLLSGDKWDGKTIDSMK